MANTETATKKTKLAIDKQGYMDVGGVALLIHRNTVHKAWSIGETGDSFSVIEWSGADDDRVYKGESANSGRILVLASGAEAYQTKLGDLAFRVGGKTEIAEELLDPKRGRVIDCAFGGTRGRGDEEVVWASELLKRLEEFWEGD